jgi:hypothetical protein
MTAISNHRVPLLLVTSGTVLTSRNNMTGGIMTRVLLTCISILLLAACSIPHRDNPLPPLKSPDTAAQVLLKNVFPGKPDSYYELTFILDNDPIFRFGDTREFSFYADSGNYMFGYSHGSKNCETSVYLRPNGNYVFELGPDCHIEMISE